MPHMVGRNVENRLLQACAGEAALTASADGLTGMISREGGEIVC
jgi:hypothetical protein